MPQTPHVEKHFTASETVRDIVIGMSDGLTVPFALAAGLSGAVVSSGIIVTAGLAEIAAGSIAMGLGGYLAGRSDAEHYASEYAREHREIIEKNDAEVVETAEIFQEYGLTHEEISPLLDSFQKNHESWVNFMMRFELGLEKPDPRRALYSGLTIAASYIAGGLLPMGPYMIFSHAQTALLVSILITFLALILFGYIKGRFTGAKPIHSALHTLTVGGLAAAAAYFIARLIA
ncbi:MAG: VIT1/CCC1 transporter family protein [Ignavibacteriae bacterium]|nr:VIT1/CCC1 transporter family protein [Ignavibacteria bacterium]MBI3364991.1 VIT1/CCC1 transporter family protein [Ignavibacteriota bacterium]